MRSWFETLSWAHVPTAIELARLPRAVFASGPGTGGGGGGVRVVALMLVEFDETLPAASRAATVYVKVVLPVRPASAKLVVDGLPTCVPLRRTT